MRSLINVIVLSLIPVISGFRLPENRGYQFNYENVLGTSLELKVTSGDERMAQRAEQTALMEIDRLALILSTYDQASEISKWQKTKDVAIKVSPELFEVLSLFEKWNSKSSGALNAAIAVASDVWENAEISDKMPTGEEMLSAVETMKQPQWRLDAAHQTATHLTSAPLVLNSFVKSYIIHSVSEKMLGIEGVTGAVINIGGDVVVAGTSTETIRITDPMANAENDHPISMLSLHERAVATSGNYRRGFEVEGQWFSHIIDPRTAFPASHVLSATVIAENATDAGALATAFNVLQPEESVKLAATIPGVEYQIITREGNQIVSGGWRQLTLIANKESSIEKLQAKLIIELELTRFEGRFRRPFVAIWIENTKKESVKTIALWFNKPRWLPDLKRWYSKNQSMMGDMSVVGSISSATRSPGRYTLSWDGTNDEGELLPLGTYTVYIEAAREHGTYQLIKQDISWNGKPGHFDLKGGVEITSASLDISK